MEKIAPYSAAIARQSKCRNAIALFTLCTLLVLFGAKAPLNANSAVALLFSRYWCLGQIMEKMTMLCLPSSDASSDYEAE
jgi:hypothetical protein